MQFLVDQIRTAVEIADGLVPTLGLPPATSDRYLYFCDDPRGREVEVVLAYNAAETRNGRELPPSFHLTLDYPDEAELRTCVALPADTDAHLLADVFLALVVRARTGQHVSPYCWGETHPTIYTDLADALVALGLGGAIEVTGEGTLHACGLSGASPTVSLRPCPGLEFTIFADVDRQVWSLARYEHGGDLEWVDLPYLVSGKPSKDNELGFYRVAVPTLADALHRLSLRSQHRAAFAALL